MWFDEEYARAQTHIHQAAVVGSVTGCNSCGEVNQNRHQQVVQGEYLGLGYGQGQGQGQSSWGRDGN